MSRRNNGPKLKWREDRAAYYITWTDSGRSCKRGTGTKDREEAEIIFAEWLATRRRKCGPSDPSQVLVTDCLTDYATEHAPRVAAPRVIGCAIEAMSPYWEARTVADITPLTCSSYVDWRGRSANTTRRELAVLQAAINWAFKHARITRTVAVTLPAKPPSKERWLTKHEAALLLRASRTKEARLYMPLFILIGLYTGRRKEAILSLRWPQVDLERGVIDFRKPGEVETNKRRGRVRIPDKLLPHLRRARTRGSDLGYVIHHNGQRIGDIKKGFAAACKRAGLEDVTPHTLRHTAASWLMQSGKVTPWEAADYLAMTEKVLHDIYAHLHPEHQKSAADALSMRGSRTGT